GYYWPYNSSMPEATKRAGRPRLGEERHRIPVYAASEEIERLRALAAHWHCSCSEAARRAIRVVADREGLAAADNTTSSVGESILAMFDEMIRSVPEAELRTLPADLSENLDRYLYDPTDSPPL